MKDLTEPTAQAKPFLKWAGGKRKLVPQILMRFPKKFGVYFEPFLGGGAVFFALQPERSVLSDMNSELINTYRAIRNMPLRVIQNLVLLDGSEASSEHFYKVRAMCQKTLTPSIAAARMIYLNKTCFNGLYRVNKSGVFNVPYGHHKRPPNFDIANLIAVSEALRDSILLCGEARNVVKGAVKGDLVYFDPPYDGTFTNYTKDKFNDRDQQSLRNCFFDLMKRGVHVVMSNADTTYIRDLYRQSCFKIKYIQSPRSINSRGDGRGPVNELLISST